MQKISIKNPRYRFVKCCEINSTMQTFSQRVLISVVTDHSILVTDLRVKGTDNLAITWSRRERDKMNNLGQSGRANVRVNKNPS